jgi:hypothetical protein
MNSSELETAVAAPIQLIGMSYYFDPATAAHGQEHGLNMFEFYGIGRAGVMGDPSVQEIQEAFWFFHERAISGLWSSARGKIEPVTGANEHLQAAFNYADRVFAGIDEATLRGFADAAHKVIAAVPTGRYALVDGYRNFPVPTNATHAAYLGSILLRELRGGVHIHATREFSVGPNEACFLSNETIFKMHGYNDDDTPDRSDDLESRMAQAEALTTQMMATYLDVLNDDERSALANGVTAMNSAVTSAPAA